MMPLAYVSCIEWLHHVSSFEHADVLDFVNMVL